MAQIRYEETTIKQTLNRVTAPSMPFAWSINPYRGCAHGCSFCYARKFQPYFGRTADDQFQRHIVLKSNAAEALEEQLSRFARRNGGIRRAAVKFGEVAIGTATDPYQPAEAKAELTRSCLKVLAKYGIKVAITTRSPLVRRDLDILREMDSVTVNISINTLDAVIARKLEPASPLPAKRLETVAALAENGIRTGVFAAPILPYLTDSVRDVDALFGAARANGAAFVYPSLLRLAPDVRNWYYRTLEQFFPHLLSAYDSLYRSVNAGQTYADAMKATFRQLLDKHGFGRPDAESELRQPPAEQLAFRFDP